MSKESIKPEIKIGLSDIKNFLQEAELDRVQNEFFNRLVTILLATVGLVTALAWDGVLREMFAQYLGDESGLIQKIYYAVTVTFLAAAISVFLGKLTFYRSKKSKKDLMKK